VDSFMAELCMLNALFTIYRVIPVAANGIQQLPVFIVRTLTSPAKFLVETQKRLFFLKSTTKAAISAILATKID